MLLRPFLYDITAGASYLFGCGTQSKLAVVDPHVDLVDDYLAAAAALRVYRRHYNEHRPHRALQLLPPNGRDPTPLAEPTGLRRRDLLGGLIHDYEAA